MFYENFVATDKMGKSQLSWRAGFKYLNQGLIDRFCSQGSKFYSTEYSVFFFQNMFL